MTPPHHRLAWIDHLRAGTFLLLLWDHSVHAYADKWGRFHFFRDFERSGIWDVFYMHDNSVIMPLLFFIFGLFVFPAAAKKGTKRYIKERLIKLGIPYIIGIPFIVPLLIYPRYQYLTNPLMEYGEFWKTVYFQEKLQGGGPFWVLYCLLLFTLIALALDKVVPGVRRTLGRMALWGKAHALGIFSVFSLTSVVILGISDILWGAPWWVGFGHFDTQGETFWVVLDKITNLFHLQGSRFLTHALYFTAGIALSQAGLTFQDDFWKTISGKWAWWLVLMALFGTAYTWYSLTYFEGGAYSDEAHRIVDAGGTWQEAWPVLKETVPMTLVRTTLHGFFCLFQVLTYVSLFHRFMNYTNRFWSWYTPCAYGIFLLHEVPVIWLQYLLADVMLPTFGKVLIVFLLGFLSTWLFVDVIRRAPFIKRILG